MSDELNAALREIQGCSDAIFSNVDLTLHLGVGPSFAQTRRVLCANIRQKAQRIVEILSDIERRELE
jgi:hypothetical protein